MIRRSVLGAGALIVLFHAWLLAGQAWDGRLADPALILRWAVAGAIVVALIALRRAGTSVFRGRKAVAIWLLAALLHGPAAARHLDGIGEPALPEFVATLTQLAVASGAALGLGWLFARALVRRREIALVRDDLAARDCPRPFSSPTTSFVRFSPRPPPIRSLI
ncbi:MAG: hypothetical protein ACM4AI_06895 [Acidobacteriota bacterium]